MTGASTASDLEAVSPLFLNVYERGQFLIIGAALP